MINLSPDTLLPASLIVALLLSLFGFCYAQKAINHINKLLNNDKDNLR